MLLPSGPSKRWSLDFLADRFGVSRRFRILAVIDDYTREWLALVADTSLSGGRVARELDAVIRLYGKPELVVSDNVLHKEAAATWRQKISIRQLGAAGAKVNRRGTSAADGRARGHSKHRIHAMDFAGPHRP